MSTMKAARIYGVRDIRIEDVPIPEVDPGDCLVEVEWCGICGSDLHEYLEGGLMAVFGMNGGITLGHEFCGRIKSAPEGSNLKVGQPVMVDPHYYCQTCPSCISGKDHICPKLAFLGGGVKGGGGLSQFVAVLESHCLPLPDNVSLDFAAVIEPLVVCHHAVKAAGMKLEGLDVLITGGGPIGVALISVLRAHQVKTIVLSEPTAKRKGQAKDLVERVIDPRTEKVGDVCWKLTDGKGVDIVFDCAGVQPGLEAAFEALKHGGIVVNIAVWDKPMMIQFKHFFLKEIKLYSSCCYNADDFKEVMDLMAKGHFGNYERMVTSRIALEDTVSKGFEELVNNREEQIKILISPKVR